MSENTKIEWCDYTWSPWEGCQKVGPGCDHCYAEARNARFAGGTAVNWGAGAPRRRTAPDSWKLPLRWDRKARELGKRLRIFPSLCDPFDNAVDLLWRRDLFRLIADTPNLDWLLLTKRIGNVPTMLRHIGVERLPDNVWLGATIVNQEEADRDIPKLLSVPARVRFLSMEPLLGPVDLTRVMRSSPDSDWSYCDDVLRGFRAHKCGGHISPGNAVNWVIVGGESGPGARPMHPDWARSLRDQCAAAGVPFLFKQWGEWIDHDQRGVDMLGTVHSPLHEWPDGRHSVRLGKRAAGRLLDGRTHDEFPEAR
ncbi:TPA: phage Gp37/Gp68 family protein [Burkholderia cenocepacia]|uniref:phage Gp37/Gp68 family protein n=1 Tax=unclassified Burkholderia TaxID=2613784 RepID=UPI00158D5762|nr:MULTISPECIES: phage Gp37/Gp68 family protein [unclassified Burkholderia]HEF5873302.1 phage Gp37/Gp68 family protein [Burkholderia cenocepacia]